MQSVDDLAKTITALPRSEQEALIDKVARLNFLKGLADLSDRYRARLARQERLDIPAEEVWEELRRIRDEVAERACPD
jgi:hypothetical protein